MLKKFFIVIASTLMAMSFSLADVDVNKADQVALDGIKGLGPAKSKAILAERAKGGNFKDWADFSSRVKGIGDKSAMKLSEAGLTVNGQAMTASLDKVSTSKSKKSESAAPSMDDVEKTKASSRSKKDKSDASK